VQSFTNGFDTKTKGADLVVSYPFQLGDLGRLESALHLTTISATSRNTTRRFIHSIANRRHRTLCPEPAREPEFELCPRPDSRRGTRELVWYVPGRERLSGPAVLRPMDHGPGSVVRGVQELHRGHRGAQYIQRLSRHHRERQRSNLSSTGGDVTGQRYPRTGGPFGFNARSGMSG